METRLGPQQLRLGVSQMIPWPGLLNARKDLANAMAEIKSVDSENYLLEVEYQVKKAYYNLYGLKQKSSKIEEQIYYLNTLKDISTSRIEVGQAKLSDIILIESRIIELEGRIQALKQAEISPTLIIDRFTLRDNSEAITIVDSFNLVSDVSFSEEFIQSLHPQLVKLDKMKAVSNKAIDLTNYQVKPKIGVGLDYILVGQREDMMPDNNGRDILIPMGKISIPLNRSQYRSKREEELLKIAAMDLYKEDLTQAFMTEIQTAKNQMSQSRINYEWNSRVIENNLTAIDLIQTAYTASSASIDELLLLHMENIKYELAKIDAVVNSLLAKATVEKFKLKS